VRSKWIKGGGSILYGTDADSAPARKLGRVYNWQNNCSKNELVLSFQMEYFGN
jgi:hypothetical protein